MSSWAWPNIDFDLCCVHFSATWMSSSSCLCQFASCAWLSADFADYQSNESCVLYCWPWLGSKRSWQEQVEKEQQEKKAKEEEKQEEYQEKKLCSSCFSYYFSSYSYFYCPSYSFCTPSFSFTTYSFSSFYYSCTWPFCSSCLFCSFNSFSFSYSLLLLLFFLLIFLCFLLFPLFLLFFFICLLLLFLPFLPFTFNYSPTLWAAPPPSSSRPQALNTLSCASLLALNIWSTEAFLMRL